MRILIAVPTFENIYPDTFKSIYNAATYYSMGHCDDELIFDFVRGYDCATARNNIAQKALDLKTDYVLMVDNDVTLPLHVFDYMLDDPKDVCLGYYAHRDADNIYKGNTCICKLQAPDGTYYYNYPLESEYTAEDMKAMMNAGMHKILVHGGGMGCAFIKTDVFRTINYPWYDWVNYADDNRGMLSEDLYFCEQCRFNSIPIYTDTRVACGHMLRHLQMP